MDSFIFNTMAAPSEAALLTEALPPQPYLALLLKINLVRPVKELSSAESGNTGSYSTELLEVSKSQQKTGCNRNTMFRGRDTARAAGQERWGGQEVKPEMERNARVEDRRTKWGTEQREYHSQLHCFTWWSPSLKGQLLCNSPRLTR